MQWGNFKIVLFLFFLLIWFIKKYYKVILIYIILINSIKNIYPHKFAGIKMSNFYSKIIVNLDIKNS